MVLEVGSKEGVITAAKSDALDCNNSFSIDNGVVDGVDQPVNSVVALIKKF